MTVNRKTCSSQYDFQKTPRTGRTNTSRRVSKQLARMAEPEPQALSMTIVVGRGNARRVFNVPSIHARSRDMTERLTEDLKALALRPATFNGYALG